MQCISLNQIMPIEETQLPNKEAKLPESNEQKPLLQISLPAPLSGDPMAPLPIGQHNSAAQKNFKQVADLFLIIINNQKAMSGVVVEQGKAIKELQKKNKELAENIRKLLKENNHDSKSSRN